MEATLKSIERFLQVYALSWGMIALYIWVLACGGYFYYRYYSKTIENRKKPKVTGKFKSLIERLHFVKSQLMESDDNVEEAEKVFDQIEIDAIPLQEKFGDDTQFMRIMGEIRILFDKAYARIDAKERDHANVDRFMKGQSSGSSSDDDEMM